MNNNYKSPKKEFFLLTVSCLSVIITLSIVLFSQYDFNLFGEIIYVIFSILLLFLMMYFLVLSYNNKKNDVGDERTEKIILQAKSDCFDLLIMLITLLLSVISIPYIFKSINLEMLINLKTTIIAITFIEIFGIFMYFKFIKRKLKEDVNDDLEN